jgi:hypothetical protein
MTQPFKLTKEQRIALLREQRSTQASTQDMKAKLAACLKA